MTRTIQTGRNLYLGPYVTVDSLPFLYGRHFEEQGYKIGKNVSIHSHTNIDSGTERPTTIKNNVKIDSHCHIGHDCIIGDNTIIAAGTILGGFVEIGKNCRLGLGVIVKNRVKIADNSIIGMGCHVTHDVSGHVLNRPLLLPKKRIDKIDLLKCKMGARRSRSD